jgi:hypothetical protein
MATTTNYGWTTPDDTALVKDGAAAIRTLGSSVDTTTKALNPSTTLGDIEYRSSTANTNTRLGIGTTGQLLTVSGGVPTWATPAGGGGMTLLSTTTLSGASTTISSIDQTYNTLMFVAFNMENSAQSGNKFSPNGSNSISETIYGIAVSAVRLQWSFTDTLYIFGSEDATASNSNNASVLTIYNYASTTASVKNHLIVSRGITGSGAGQKTTVTGSGGIITSSAITSMTIAANTGNLTGTVLMYGVK